MCVYMYICIYVCICINVCICIYDYICVYDYICTVLITTPRNNKTSHSHPGPQAANPNVALVAVVLR